MKELILVNKTDHLFQVTFPGLLQIKSKCLLNKLLGKTFHCCNYDQCC